MPRFLLPLLIAVVLVMGDIRPAAADVSRIAAVPVGERADCSGRVWSEAEILALGVVRFEKAWPGRWRDAVNLYVRVATVRKQRYLAALAHVSPSACARLKRLDRDLTELDGGIGDVCFAMNGGGTAVMADALRLDAMREDSLGMLAAAAERDPGMVMGKSGSIVSGSGRLRKAMIALRGRVKIHRRHFLLIRSGERPDLPWHSDRFGEKLAGLEIALDRLEGDTRMLPDVLARGIAERLEQDASTLDQWRSAPFWHQ